VRRGLAPGAGIGALIGMMHALAILGMVAGILVTLMVVGLLLAGSPNSSPEQFLRIKRLMLGMALVGLGGLSGAVWAMVAGRPGLAGVIGVAPAALGIGLLVYLFATEG
jgi:hypothetical protein